MEQKSAIDTLKFSLIGFLGGHEDVMTNCFELIAKDAAWVQKNGILLQEIALKKKKQGITFIFTYHSRAFAH